MHAKREENNRMRKMLAAVAIMGAMLAVPAEAGSVSSATGQTTYGGFNRPELNKPPHAS